MRSLIFSGLVSASVGFFGNGAAAAPLHTAARPPAAAAAHAGVAARDGHPVAPGYGFGPPRVDAVRIVNGLLRSPLVAPYVAQYGGRVRVTRNSGGTGGTYVPYDPPTYDAAPPPDTSIQDMLNNQAQQQAIDSMNQTNAAVAAQAAVDAQIAADNAAMTQQIMNNGGL